MTLDEAGRRRAIKATKRDAASRNKVAKSIERMLQGKQPLDNLNITDGAVRILFKDLIQDNSSCPPLFQETLVQHNFAEDGADVPYYGRVMKVSKKSNKDI